MKVSYESIQWKYPMEVSYESILWKYPMEVFHDKAFMTPVNCSG